MHILKNNPFYLKFFTGIEGYLQLFLAPIIIFKITQDIKLSGLFFLIDSICKFSAYSIAGSVIKPDTLDETLRYSYVVRFVCIFAFLVIFALAPKNQYILLTIANLGFTISNSFFVTSMETLFQNHQLFDKNVQSKLTMGDLISGSAALICILLFTILKISYAWLIPLAILTFIGGVTAIIKLIEALHKMTLRQLRSIFKNGIKEFNSTISFIRGNDELITNMIIGYIPFAFFLIVEQINIYRFSATYEDSTMQILHYSFKTIWYLTGAFIVPQVVSKSKDVNQVFLRGVYCFIIGGLCSLLYGQTWLNLFGVLLLGYSHNLIFIYRKVNRRKILDAANVGFHSLGVFFAVEGLSGMISSVYLSVFGKNQVYLIISFILAATYLVKKAGIVKNKEKIELNQS